MVYYVGFENCGLMALIGHNSVLYTDIPKNNNLTHTCWMNVFPLVSSSGAEEDYVAYCFMATQLIGMLRYGALCYFSRHAGIVSVPFLCSL